MSLEELLDGLKGGCDKFRGVFGWAERLVGEGRVGRASGVGEIAH